MAVMPVYREVAGYIEDFGKGRTNHAVVIVDITAWVLFFVRSRTINRMPKVT